MDEFELIERIRAAMPVRDEDVLAGIGDDCARLRVSAGWELVATTDTLNEGIHFAAGTAAADIGHKALAVSLSDVASMGAVPRWALLNLSLPQGDDVWVGSFMEGFEALAAGQRVSLVGGDTTRGPLSITVTVLALVEAGRSMQRSDARPGDLVAVSGTPGDAALALRLELAGQAVTPRLRRALHRPEPRVGLGRALSGRARACIDLSDGLLADLGHVCAASGCAAELELAKLPASPELRALAAEERWPLQLAGGDDYELCFTIDPSAAAIVSELSSTLGLELTVVGRMTAGSGVRCLAPDGDWYEPASAGYEHFRGGD